MQSASTPYTEPPWKPEHDEVERRAVRGVALLVGRTVGLQTVTLGGTVVLARLLAPRDYGSFAIALMAQQVGRFIVDLGLPAALIRRQPEMTAAEEHAVAGLSAAGASAFAAVLVLTAFVIMPLAGATSPVVRLVAVTALALPIYTLRTIPAIRLERRLEFGKMVGIEVAETVTFYAFAIPAAVLGLGAFSLAGAIVAGAATSSIVATVVRPWQFGWSLDFAAVRPLLAFGARASVLAPIQLLRELLALLVLTAAGGPALAGYYNLAARLYSLHLSISYAVQRVALSAFSRGETDDERNRQGARAVVVTTLVAALPLAVIVGGAHVLIVLLFGSRWAPTAAVVEWAGAGWLLMSGVTSVLTSLALAQGDARGPLQAAVVQATVVVAAAAFLTRAIGSAGAGVAVSLGALASAAVLFAWNRAVSRAAIPAVARISLVTAAAVLVATRLGEAASIASVATAIAVSAATWLLLAVGLMHTEMSRLAAVLKRNLRARRTAPVRGDRG